MDFAIGWEDTHLTYSLGGANMKTVSMSLKVPEDVHQKFKIYSVLSGKSMSEIIIDYIETIDIQMPTLKTARKKPRKKTLKTGKKKVAKPVKRTSRKTRKDRNPDADEGLIKERILKHQAAGLSHQKISDALAAESIPTLRGGLWNRGKVGSLIKKWDRKAAQSAEDTPG
jgi:hypothetical protein